jgi:hypothetical protein
VYIRKQGKICNFRKDIVDCDKKKERKDIVDVKHPPILSIVTNL